jgi:hypothetical protein
VEGKAMSEETKPPDSRSSSIKLSDCIILRIIVENDETKPPRGLYLVVHSTLGYLSVVAEGFIGPQALVSKFGVDLGRKMLVRIVGELNTTPTEYAKLLKELSHKMVRIVD